MQSKLPRVLAVDDDVDLLRVVAHALELAGLEVAMATSAGAALRWIDREGLPHLGLFDVNMPEKTGIELCREIHRFADLPVIFLTVIDDEDTLVSTIEELAEDYLTKPFRPRELVARVRGSCAASGTVPSEAGQWFGSTITSPSACISRWRSSRDARSP